jgi:hypothetical protein
MRKEGREIKARNIQKLKLQTKWMTLIVASVHFSNLDRRVAEREMEGRKETP